MQDSLGTWVIKTAITTVATPAPRVAVQYGSSSSNTAEILYFKISQSGSTTSAMDSVSLVRVTTSGTGMTVCAVGTANLFDYTGNTTGGAGTFRGTLSSTTTATVATAASTYGDVIHQMDFNVLAGYEWNAQPNMRVWVPISSLIAVRCDALVAATYNVELVIRESK